jgi:hypothetical protein
VAKAGTAKTKLAKINDRRIGRPFPPDQVLDEPKGGLLRLTKNDAPVAPLVSSPVWQGIDLFGD